MFSGSLTIQKLKGSMFFFGEAGGGYSSGHWNTGTIFRTGSSYSSAWLRIGAGIHRKYKDFGVFISHGLEYEGEDETGTGWSVGLQTYPRVVAYWTL